MPQVFYVDADGGEGVIQTLQADAHARYRATTLHAWRVRTHAGVLLAEISGVVPPPDGTGLTSVHINGCEP